MRVLFCDGIAPRAPHYCHFDGAGIELTFSVGYHLICLYTWSQTQPQQFSRVVISVWLWNRLLREVSDQLLLRCVLVANNPYRSYYCPVQRQNQ